MDWRKRGAGPGPDGRARCPWVAGLDAPPDYVAYHDDEWGRAVHGDRALLERIVLEGFQSGLSWLTILRKREAFRSAFAAFDPQVVAGYDETDVARLMGDARIVRHRGKIEAAVTNSRATMRLVDRDGEGALDRLVWRFAAEPTQTRHPARTWGDVPARTAASEALAKGLKAAGFVFIGPTTAYAAMQACGLVNDHLAACEFR